MCEFVRKDGCGEGHCLAVAISQTTIFLLSPHPSNISANITTLAEMYWLCRSNTILFSSSYPQFAHHSITRYTPLYTISIVSSLYHLLSYTFITLLRVLFDIINMYTYECVLHVSSPIRPGFVANTDCSTVPPGIITGGTPSMTRRQRYSGAGVTVMHAAHTCV